MPRRYTVCTDAVAVSAAQDLAQIKGASGKSVRILRVRVGFTDTTLVTAQGLQTRCRFLPATVTDGSGGSTPTPRRDDPGDAAASFTALCNNTTPATTNATATLLAVGGDHIYAGVEYDFRHRRVMVGPSESFTVELESTVSGTVHLSTTVEVEEECG